MTSKSSGAAIVLSLFWTGLGQLYAGATSRGLLLMTATPVLWMIAWFGGLADLIGTTNAITGTGGFKIAALGVLGLPVAYWVWGVIDAKRVCDRHNAELVVERTHESVK